MSERKNEDVLYAIKLIRKEEPTLKIRNLRISDAYIFATCLSEQYQCKVLILNDEAPLGMEQVAVYEKGREKEITCPSND